MGSQNQAEDRRRRPEAAHHDLLCRMAEQIISLECEARTHNLPVLAKHLGAAVDELDHILTAD